MKQNPFDSIQKAVEAEQRIRPAVLLHDAEAREFRSIKFDGNFDFRTFVPPLQHIRPIEPMMRPPIENAQISRAFTEARSVLLQDSATKIAESLRHDGHSDTEFMEFISKYGNIENSAQFENIFTETYEPIEEYEFKNNPFLICTQQELRLMAPTILVLEAMLQQQEDAKLWYQLGIIQQENEHDEEAIVALKNAERIDPELDIQLPLSVSYTNENNLTMARTCLEKWLKKRMNVENLEQDLLKYAPNGGFEAYEALGILYNVNEEYEKAIEFFKRAVDLAPVKHSLLNRLGATLANAGATQEAVETYHEALLLKPDYVRVHYNLAIACINMGQSKEAAKHLHSALELQQGTVSDSVWRSLRTVGMLLGVEEVQLRCDVRDLNGVKDIFKQI